EEAILSEKSITGASAWSRLFSQLTAEISVELADDQGASSVSLEEALSSLAAPESSTRADAAAAITTALSNGLSTRAFVFNTLLQDKSITDRLRSYPTWLSGRNLSNEATDESVQALIDAVVSRYDIPQRWYRLKAQILGQELFDYDRMATVAETETRVGWAEATEIVLDAYGAFSPELASTAKRFFDERWIDAPIRPAKRPGAFCSYTVPSHHPYVFLNWTGRPRDVMTLAHELGHGCHAFMSRPQGVFHFQTPLTLAETASVFGETLTFQAMLAAASDPRDRLALLAENIEGSIATVFRQIAMNRFEDSVHAERRDVGELSTDRFGDLWIDSQRAMLGESITLTHGYRDWWSYIPHFIGTPGYVYAYAYGQLLALSVYGQYKSQGPDFVSRYLSVLSSGGSMPPEELGLIVGCDLGDPGFWMGGLDLVEKQLDLAEAAWDELKP
ncbi:MAG: M3 family oligoendopeptidase, partial [Actinobacteria bacterium]|nr:M3 family oligoendopeptidase [Actinomycetota bacterium]